MDSFILSEHRSMIQQKCYDTFNSICALKIKNINGTHQGWLVHKDCSCTALAYKQPVTHTCTDNRGLLKLKYYIRVDCKLHIIANLYVLVPSSFSGFKWSSGQHAGLWYPSSRVQTQLKPSDFLGEKILSVPSFGGEVKPSVPCCKFAACKGSLQLPWKSQLQAKLISHFSPILPPFADRGLSRRLTWSASGDDGGN